MRAAKWADVVALVHKAPRTVPELVHITELGPDAIRGYLHTLAAEGLIDPGPRRGTSAIVWTWKHRVPPAPATPPTTRPAVRQWLNSARQALDEVERMAA